MGGVVKRAYKYRFYPSPEQAAQLNRTFGCVRLVYNRALEARTRAWAVDRQRTTYVQSSGWLTEWKRTDELAFLNEVSSVPLQQTLRHLQAGFVAFWDKRARYPRFKSKRKSRASAEYTRSAFRWRDGRLTLAKMTAPLAIVWSRPLPEGAEPSTVTVSRDAAGRWFVSLLVEDPTVKPLPPVAAEVGVDAGITSLLTLSRPISGVSDEQGKVANPRYGQADRRKLAKAQRNMARKQKGSANRAKARLKVARIHARIADRRRDHLHQLTSRLVRETQTVAIEDLSVRNMLRNRRLARVISDAAWGQFRSMLEYKAQWYGREVVPVDRWLPSSKTCSACGWINTTLALNDRSWTCPGCGVEHDRDINAAKNILAAGLAER
ncbi:transposase [Micromonospora sp. DR5-3]|uniref:RNA-guided endonuclease InsQ/TnpB family protein n=1 Tax=unclassified Micromonospora TaxID=2617518 RepID=UPI0011DC4D67|nr:MULTISPECIES: RNA-guided endonuclease TnpB family protein [unclassified Micromonospora]MCW3819097.1 transposase [Micromonospora sp. DR5-3]TYC20356.1 IS200/IS605 family element transposase accessory protein TnpB [Micromonospora sp. MP36]